MCFNLNHFLVKFHVQEGTWWDDSITTCNYAGAQSPPPKCAKCMEGNNGDGGGDESSKPCDKEPEPVDEQENPTTTEGSTTTSEGTTTTTEVTTTTQPEQNEEPMTTTNKPQETTTAESIMNTTPYCPSFMETTTGTTVSMSSVAPEVITPTVRFYFGEPSDEYIIFFK